ncbi:eukaryotic translation initiation factor 3 subunit M-like [Telopea speciosissima]|uniref:eukaryotic translation initiation factor 3 subunit M-like n=1 Tax=Telopea speciosissima TaxID=54955 RepID=UPI001CC61758|nr:eukaryotic translation initiation factor 3 subunit M-like [Telopea speciosissima]
MATIVVTSEEDPALSIVRFTSELAWADAGPEVAEPQVARLCMEAQECIVMGRWLDLASLMLTSADLIFSKVSEKDLECIFTIICSLVTKPESLDEALEMAKLISAKVTQQANDKPALRLKILFNLYNLLENPYSKFYVYMKALNLAVNGKATEHIIPSFKKMDSFVKEWNIGTFDQRELFLTISNILKEHKNSAKDSFSFLTKYLTTFSGEDAYTMSEAKEEAVRAIVEFVKAPDMFQSDLLDMPAVGQLEKDGKYSLVYQLLKIFLTHRLDAYLDFHAANSTLLKSYGLVHEDCIAKMRLMTLADLGSNHGEIPYDLIKDTLRVNDDEVELWVVKAITVKLLDCKMDQMNQVVIVNRCTERVFGLHQWLALRSKLTSWRGNIANVINTVQANKGTEDGTQAMQGLAIR